MNNESVKGLRANCTFHDEFVWGKDGDFDELELITKSIKTDPRPFSEEVKIISTPKEFEVKNDT